jgi:hypothetical protein
VTFVHPNSPKLLIIFAELAVNQKTPIIHDILSPAADTEARRV